MDATSQIGPTPGGSWRILAAPKARVHKWTGTPGGDGDLADCSAPSSHGQKPPPQPHPSTGRVSAHGPWRASIPETDSGNAQKCAGSCAILRSLPAAQQGLIVLGVLLGSEAHVQQDPRSKRGLRDEPQPPPGPARFARHVTFALVLRFPAGQLPACLKGFWRRFPAHHPCLRASSRCKALAIAAPLAAACLASSPPLINCSVSVLSHSFWVCKQAVVDKHVILHEMRRSCDHRGCWLIRKRTRQFFHL